MALLNSKTIEIQKTIGSTTEPSVSFRKQSYDTVIEKLGYDVVYEKAIVCPCKSRNSGNLSNCKNCGASGWVFINPTQTKMVVQSMSLNPQYKDWGVMGAEVSSVTARDIDKLSFMDRITVLNTVSEHSEVLFFNNNQSIGRLYAYTVYNPINVYYCALFKGADVPLKMLVKDIDYVVSSENKITLSVEISNIFAINETSLTIRYSHNPRYHIVEVVRDSISSPINRGGKIQIENLPLHARAKRADLVKDRENFNGDRLLDNSFKKC